MNSAMYGAEAAGLGVITGHHVPLTKGRPGATVLSWMFSKMPMDRSLLYLAGLDSSWYWSTNYHDIKRATYVPVTDEEALKDSPCLVWKGSQL